MTPKERVFSRMAGKTVDRIPNFNTTRLFAAREIGVPYSVYCTDFRHLVEGNIICAEKYSLDCVCVLSDPMREVSAFGAKIIFPYDGIPFAADAFLQNREDVQKLRAQDVLCSERTLDCVSAVAELKNRLSDEYPIIGCVEDSTSKAVALRGATAFAQDAAEGSAFVESLLEICLEQSILFATAQLGAGADIICVNDNASSALGAQYYKRYAQKYHTRLLKAIRSKGAKTRLHISGDTTPIMELLPCEYIDILDVESTAPLKEIAALHTKSCICGNYDPRKVLLGGSPQSILEAVESCARVGGKKYISSAGGDVPELTPERNLLLVHRALLALEARPTEPDSQKTPPGAPKTKLLLNV